MLSVDHVRWGQTPEDLRRLAMGAPHRRTRERFLALHEIAQGGCATRVAVRAGRHPQTVMGWLHAYSAHGPDALAYRRTGGRPPCMGRPLSRRIRRRCACARCSKDWAFASGGPKARRTLYPVGSHRAGPSSRIQRGHRPRWTGPIFLTVDQPKGGSVTRPSWSIGKRCCRAPISSLTPASRHLPAQCRWPDSATGRRSACAPVPPP
jgi:hypothetical protein